MRAVGSLVGLAIGDAMGAPLEGLPPPPVPVTLMTSGGRHHRRAGSYTDDTLQALALTRSLLHCHGYDGRDALQRLVKVYSLDPQVFGPTSTAVFDLILQNTPPEDAARYVHSTRGSRSNGSVMRGIPLGIFYRDPGVVHDVSLSCSRLTHLDPVPGECSAVMNILVSGLSRGMKKAAALPWAIRWCESEEVAAMLIRFDDYEPVPSLDALDATHGAIRLFMEAASFEEAVVHAVNLGGDADTIGALCGALAGACWGLPEIPLRWLEVLRDAPMILEIASRLSDSAEP